MDVFWNAAEAFGNVLIEKMDFVGLEATFWFWFLFALWMWMNNVRGWLRQNHRYRIAKGMHAEAEREKQMDAERSKTE